MPDLIASITRAEHRIGADRNLDFARPFLPESLARVQPLAFLTARERLTLNHIRGHGYLCLFALFEEHVVPFVLDHPDQAREGTRGPTSRDDFTWFRTEFEMGFGSTCDVIGPPADIARMVLSYDPLSVALAVLHFEWMTQRHYIDSIRDDEAMDPRFKGLLRRHWMEEAEHARTDTLLLQAMAAGHSQTQRLAAVRGYLEIMAYLDAALTTQVAYDLDTFGRAAGRHLEPLSAEEREAFIHIQLQAVRWTFLGSGMTHPRFLQTLGALAPIGRVSVERIAPAFC